MTLPSLRSPQTHHSANSETRNRLALSPQTSSNQFSVTRLTESQRKTERVVCMSAQKRLFDGTGRGNDESNALVRLGEKLHSEEELDQALIKFTAAIADKDKCKANDLSHAQAYLGAAAIFECQGDLEKALDQYHIGSRILNRLQQNPTLLAGSYVRIALLYEGKGKYYFNRAIEFFKKALKIYSLNADQQHVAKVRNELSKIYLKQGETKTAKKYANEAREIKLFQKGQSFLHDYLELHTKTEREVSLLSSRSSVDTEPSPLKEVRLPSIHVGCSPTQILLFNKNVGTSPEKQKDSSHSPMQIETRNKQVGPSPQSIQNTASSPIRFLPEINGTAQAKLDANLSPIRFNQNVGTSPEQQKDSSHSPMQIETRNKQVGPSPQSIQNTASSPIRFLPEIKGTAQAKIDVNLSPIRIERKELSSVIEQLKKYEPGFLERGKGKVAKALLERSEKFAKGEFSLDEMQAYIDAQFDIEDNPALAGRRTHRLKDIFEEARKQLALLKRTN